LALWKNGDYALVLTDINMTALNGYDLARSIRALEAAQGRARTPVLGWTANALADTHARCLTAGMDDVLHKPADLAHLRELLAHWLPSFCADDAAAKAADPLDRDAELPALDAKLLHESFGNDSNKLRLLLPTIQKTLNEQISAMNAALSASDVPSLKTWGHNISGSAGLMGAKALMGVSQRIEAMADKGDVSALPELAHQFNTQAQRTTDALSRMG
jgi:CheY-like chemotaxis protein